MGADAPGSTAATIGRRLRGPGWLLLILSALTGAAALHTANNRLYIVLGGMVALLLLELVLGSWNLRNLTAARRLPPEVFANRGARGRLLLRNPRRLLPAASLELWELGGYARAHAAWLGPGEALELPLTWRFPARGRAVLAGIELRSRFPFGLMEHRRVVPRSAPVLVYPTALGQPGHEHRHILGGHALDDDMHDPRGTGTGDFLDMREYQPGDPARLIHWRTSARVGRPMIVVRGSDSDEEVLVELEARREPHRWERGISEACGQILHHVRIGRAVGLRVGRRTWPPRRGAPQHRTLLTALALLPHADDPELEP